MEAGDNILSTPGVRIRIPSRWAILPDMDAADGGVLYRPEEAAAQADGRNKVICRYGLMLPRPSLLKGPGWPLDLNPLAAGGGLFYFRP